MKIRLSLIIDIKLTTSLMASVEKLFEKKAEIMADKSADTAETRRRFFEKISKLMSRFEYLSTIHSPFLSTESAITTEFNSYKFQAEDDLILKMIHEEWEELNNFLWAIFSHDAMSGHLSAVQKMRCKFILENLENLARDIYNLKLIR